MDTPLKALMVILTLAVLGLAGCAGRTRKEPASASLQAKDTGMNWTIEHIFHYVEPKLWGQGHAHYMFHDQQGHRIFFDYFNHWIGRLGPDDTFVWTAGVPTNVPTGYHIAADFVRPIFLADAADGTYLVACDGNARIFRLNPDARTASLFLDVRALGGKDISACVLDRNAGLWVSETTGCRIWHFDSAGNLIETLGTGERGFNADTVPFERARFGWVYAMRMGPDGRLYVLDSTNFAVRRIDPRRRVVETIAGTGKPGPVTDSGPASVASFGSEPGEQFNGAYGLCVDEAGNLYVADTFNHVVRMINAATGVIATIAGNPEVIPHQCNDPALKDPRRLNLPKICGLEYFGGRLFVPEWDGDLIVLRRQ